MKHLSPGKKRKTRRPIENGKAPAFAEALCRKPISRVLCAVGTASPPFISATHPPGLGEQPSNPGLHGLTARKVYPFGRLPGRSVSPYLTFSPLPRLLGAVSFLRHFLLSHNYSCNTPVFTGYGALRCPDFPPPETIREAVERFARQSYERSTGVNDDLSCALVAVGVKGSVLV